MTRTSLFKLSCCTLLTIATLNVGNAEPVCFIEKCDHPFRQASFWHPLVMVTGGELFTSNAGRYTEFAQGFSKFRYQPTEGSQYKPLYGLSIGNEMYISPHFAWQSAISFYRDSHLNVSGSLTQGVTPPSSDIYGYSYAIATQQLLLENKLMARVNNRLLPYFTFGLGTAFNNSYDFRTTAQPTLVFTPQFPSKKVSSFSYNLGVGVDVNIEPHTRLGLGYRFTNFGRTSLGNGTINTTALPYTLSQSHLYVNELVAQISYVL